MKPWLWRSRNIWARRLNDRDSKYVACGDESERNTVRDAFLKKKLGLSDENEAFLTPKLLLSATK